MVSLTVYVSFMETSLPVHYTPTKVFPMRQKARPWKAKNGLSAVATGCNGTLITAELAAPKVENERVIAPLYHYANVPRYLNDLGAVLSSSESFRAALSSSKYIGASLYMSM